MCFYSLVRHSGVDKRINEFRMTNEDFVLISLLGDYLECLNYSKTSKRYLVYNTQSARTAPMNRTIISRQFVSRQMRISSVDNISEDSQHKFHSAFSIFVKTEFA